MEYSEEVLSIEDQRVIIDWTKENWDKFIYNKNNSGYFIFIDALKNDTEYKNIYTIFQKIKNNIMELENLRDMESHLYLSDFIYHMDPGTKLHRHKDTNENNSSYHIRFNVLIQSAEQGGIPVYSGKKIKTKERCYIICRSGLDYHSSTEIKGKKSKIVLSFGFNFDKSKIHNYPKIFQDKIQENTFI